MDPPASEDSLPPPQRCVDEEAVTGWPLVARLMTEKPDFEAFGRFRELSVKNLLYYQVQLDYLQERLQRQELQDFGMPADPHGLDRGSYHKYADLLIDSGESSNPEDRIQWNIILQIRDLLEKYNTALLQYERVSAIRSPNSRYIRTFKRWIAHPLGGNFCIGGPGSQAWGTLYTPLSDDAHKPSIMGIMAGLWHFFRSIFWPGDEQQELHLVAPRPVPHIHGFILWLRSAVLPLRYQFEGLTNSRSRYIKERKKISDCERQEDEARTVTFYRASEHSDSPLIMLMSRAATVVACVLPTGSIAVLTTAQTITQKLLWISGFTALFAIGVMYISRTASTVTIFTSTIAFSAVLVVFVQGS